MSREELFNLINHCCFDVIENLNTEKGLEASAELAEDLTDSHILLLQEIQRPPLASEGTSTYYHTRHTHKYT